MKSSNLGTFRRGFLWMIAREDLDGGGVAFIWIDGHTLDGFRIGGGLIGLPVPRLSSGNLDGSPLATVAAV